MDQTVEKKKPSFTDRMRGWFRWLIDPVSGFFVSLGIPANTMTLIGLAGTTASAALIAMGRISWGGLLLLVTAPIDALDGPMARQRGEASNWGAFVDSVTDRYAELVVFFGLLIHFLDQGNELAVILAYLAAGGSVLVSYIKARADASGFSADVGLLTRVERYIVLIPALVFNQPLIALWIVAIFANLTALQRILRVRQQAYRQIKAKE